MPISPTSFSLSENEKTIRRALNDYLLHARESSFAEQIMAAGQISMLAEDSLYLLALLAGASSGAILEIGAYVGGSTICLAIGNRDMQRPLLTVEIGGSYSHPQLPSSDIVADLQTNLDRFGVRGDAQVIVGHAHARAVKDEVVRRLKGQKIGLFVVDADEYPARTLANFLSLLRPDCLLVFDDYLSPSAPEAAANPKGASIKPFVDGLVHDGLVREFGMFFEATWFGQVNGSGGLSGLGAIRFEPEVGFCHVIPVHLAAKPDSEHAPKASELILLEDGEQLSPAHSLHDDIRKLGHGRYAHWSSTGEPDADGFWTAELYFSTSDNTNPATNGRRYSVWDAAVLRDVADCW